MQNRCGILKKSVSEVEERYLENLQKHFPQSLNTGTKQAGMKMEEKVIINDKDNIYVGAVTLFRVFNKNRRIVNSDMSVFLVFGVCPPRPLLRLWFSFWWLLIAGTKPPQRRSVRAQLRATPARRERKPRGETGKGSTRNLSRFPVINLCRNV